MGGGDSIKNFFRNNYFPIIINTIFIIIMRSLIKKILKEEIDTNSQEIEFDGFTEPFLIKQFGIYMIQFKGTGKYKKDPETEKFIFTDKNNKEYVFDADLIQKSGNSNFFINLDDLRKEYDIEFKDDFKRYKPELSFHESGLLSKKVISDYKFEGRCKTKKCDDYRNVVESSLKELYPSYYGKFKSVECEDVEGFINYQPIPNIVDDNGNSWSMLNYYIYSTQVLRLLIKSYINENGTFEHNDFIDWVKKNKDQFFSLSNINTFSESMMNVYNKINGVTEDTIKIISNFLKNKRFQFIVCPNTRKRYSNITSVQINNSVIRFQTLSTFRKKVKMIEDGLWATKLSGLQQIDYTSDYIITTSGEVFNNDKVVIDGNMAYFKTPPVYRLN